MEYVIMDVDTGIDDALAIAYAVHCPELHIMGFTTCFGNATVEETTRNTLQVLELLEAERIPVAPGVNQTFAGADPREKSSGVHGENGIGNVELPVPAKQPLNQPAHDFIVEKVREHPQKVTLITTGSLTNVAYAIQKDPEIVHLIKRVVVMGGAVTVPGNITPYAEANIYTDPEAAQFVFQSGVPVTLVGLDVTMKTLLKKECLTDWRNKNTKLSRFLAEACEFYMSFYCRWDPDLGGCALHDPLTVAIVVDPTLVKAVPTMIQVVTEGEQRGRTVKAEGEAGAEIQVCLEVDSNRFVSNFLQRVHS
ncbi:nucleoside hydrolase [Brevibacillus sp. B_LB10_24]|uniref:nucleoside hydrolase n=1 Tax=Brevibacillus sp. B_LB10_24 TaxID=3380645 RepID=UPI0038B915C1